MKKKKTCLILLFFLLHCGFLCAFLWHEELQRIRGRADLLPTPTKIKFAMKNVILLLQPP